MKKIWKSNKNLNFEIWPWDPSTSKDLVILIISLQTFWPEAFIGSSLSQNKFLCYKSRIMPSDHSKSKDLVLLIISLQEFWSEAFIVKISSQFTFLLELWSAGRLEPVFVNIYVTNTLLIVTIDIVTTGLFHGSLLSDGCLMVVWWLSHGCLMVVSWLSHGFCFYVCSFVFMLVYLLLNLYLFIIYASWMSV